MGGERVRKISADFIGSPPIGENVEGKRNVKSLRRALDPLQ